MRVAALHLLVAVVVGSATILPMVKAVQVVVVLAGDMVLAVQVVVVLAVAVAVLHHRTITPAVLAVAE
jgi:hypothetical protein|tara:strand:+ start:564 stop:767 length:204 start_codon:yes stop_codon:yes gene_type:complete